MTMMTPYGVIGWERVKQKICSTKFTKQSSFVDNIYGSATFQSGDLLQAVQISTLDPTIMSALVWWKYLY